MAGERGGVDRRRLLGLAASALAVGACRGRGDRTGDGAPLKVRYRPLGRTGLQVSEIAFGAHGVESAALMRAALDAGINTFCTSGSYLDGAEERALGGVLQRLGATRERTVVFSGEDITKGWDAARLLAGIDASLGRLRGHVVDVFYAAQVETPAQLGAPALHEAVAEAKRAGKVRFLGLSCHGGPMADIVGAAVDDGRFDVLFIKYDLLSDPRLETIVRRAAERGIGTAVFKTTAGNRQREIKDLEAGGLSFRQATLKWALQNPAIASVAVTVSSFRVIRDSVRAVGEPLSRAEAAMLRRYARAMGDQVCRFCSTCEPRCPRGVAVADVMRYSMYFAYYGREKEAMRLYQELPAERRASKCAACSAPCEVACPHGRRLHAELIAADRRLRFEEA